MTDVSLPAGRFTEGDFRVGQVFSRAWSVFSGNFLTFVLVTGVANLPSLLVPQPTPGDVANPFQNVGLTLLEEHERVGLEPLALLSLIQQDANKVNKNDAKKC